MVPSFINSNWPLKMNSYNEYCFIPLLCEHHCLFCSIFLQHYFFFLILERGAVGRSVVVGRLSLVEASRVALQLPVCKASFAVASLVGSTGSQGPTGFSSCDAQA